MLVGKQLNQIEMPRISQQDIFRPLPVLPRAFKATSGGKLNPISSLSRSEEFVVNGNIMASFYSKLQWNLSHRCIS